MEHSDNDTSRLISVFKLDDAFFGINTSFVQEVVLPGKITPVHNAPEYILGVMNLRGKIVSVIDLGLKIRMNSAEINRESRIFIVNWNKELVGLVVDEIRDTVEIESKDLMPIPENVGNIQKEFFENIFHINKLPVSLLNLQTVLNDEEDK